MGAQCPAPGFGVGGVQRVADAAVFFGSEDVLQTDEVVEIRVVDDAVAVIGRVPEQTADAELGGLVVDERVGVQLERRRDVRGRVHVALGTFEAVADGVVSGSLRAAVLALVSAGLYRDAA